MNVICGNCGVNLKARDELAETTAKCPQCGNAIEIPNPARPPVKAIISPATERQKEYATSLGIKTKNGSRNSMRFMIERARRGRRRAEVLAELDEEDCRLSKAEPPQILEAFDKRGRGAILISFDWDDGIDFDDLAGAKFSIAFSDDLAESEVGSVLGMMGIAMTRRSLE